MVVHTSGGTLLAVFFPITYGTTYGGSGLVIVSFYFLFASANHPPIVGINEPDFGGIEVGKN